MRVTFSNQLVFADPRHWDRIKYAHHFRVDVDVIIRQRKETGRNWDITLTSNGFRSVPQDIRDALVREFKNYIRMRVKKNVNALKYSDFIDMANAISL